MDIYLQSEVYIINQTKKKQGTLTAKMRIRKYMYKKLINIDFNNILTYKVNLYKFNALFRCLDMHRTNSNYKACQCNCIVNN